MNIEAKKLSLIQELLKIDNENIINAFESLLHKSKYDHFEDGIKPMTIKQFNDEIDQAIDDEKNNRLISNEALKQKIKKWN